VPKSRLAILPLINEFTKNDERVKGMLNIINENRSKDMQIQTTIHLLSKWIFGYKDLRLGRCFNHDLNKEMNILEFIASTNRPP